MAIEEARREAKRRLRGQAAAEAAPAAVSSVKGLKTLIWLVVLTVVTVALGLVLYFTPLMSARSVDVLGIAEVPREEVIDTAQIRLGTPLLQIDTDVVADRVAGIRRVASVRVQREYPSAVRITIVERVPVVVRTTLTGPTCSIGTAWTSPRRLRHLDCPISRSTIPAPPIRRRWPRWRSSRPCGRRWRCRSAG